MHTIDGIVQSFLIRQSNRLDIQEIYKWLNEESEQKIAGNFLCNWKTTYKYHEEGKLFVLIDEIKEIPVAYQWGRLLTPGIIQVRNNWRRKGLGRLFVEYCVELALLQDEMILQVECKPSSSIPFWSAMDFRIVNSEHEENAKGFRVLSKKLVLPPNGKPISVVISFFSEDRMWNDNVKAQATFHPEAINTNDGNVYLSDRVAFHNFFQPEINDLVIEIIVENSVIYRGKAKYPDAIKYGLKQCFNGYYIDKVTYYEGML